LFIDLIEEIVHVYENRKTTDSAQGNPSQVPRLLRRAEKRSAVLPLGKLPIVLFPVWQKSEAADAFGGATASRRRATEKKSRTLARNRFLARFPR